MFKGHFIVADMDGTITSTPTKAHGHYLPLSSSPCLQPLESFIREGGDVCVVSTAGRRMWRQVFDVLRPTLFSSPLCGRLFMCGFSGAALFVSNFHQQSMEEDVKYRMTALHGKTTMLPPENLAEIQRVVQRAVYRSYRRMMEEPGYLHTLSKKYHEPLQSLLDAVNNRGETIETSELLSLEKLQKHGLYMKATGDALLDVQVVPNADGTIAPDAPSVQITALAIPMRHAAEIFPDDVLSQLVDLGVTAKFQPNSVVIARHGLDKGTCVRYLTEFCGLDLRRALAFGDIPQSIDRPLTEYPPMPFVSVSLTPEHDPPGVLWVGGEEDGTAAFLQSWIGCVKDMGAAGSGTVEPSVDKPPVDTVCSLDLIERALGDAKRKTSVAASMDPAVASL